MKEYFEAGYYIPKKRVYISGPISGRKHYKKKFDNAKELLKERYPYYEIISPLDLPHKSNSSYIDYMKLDLKVLIDCDIVYFMKGWRVSKGSLLEHRIAKKLNKEIIYEQ